MATKGKAAAASAATGKVVSLINMKGGVGKTTLAVGLAWELAVDHKVLLVDVDPQFNATQWLVPTDDYFAWLKDGAKRTAFDVFQPDPAAGGISGFRSPTKRAAASLSNAVIEVTHGTTTLHVVPSTLELMTLDASPRGTENRLKVFLDQARNAYDYILIDCPPTASLFSFSAFLASDAYLVPIKPDPLSVLGLPLLERAMKDYEQRSGHTAARLGLVLTLVRGTDAMTATAQQLRVNYPKDVFASTIRQTTGVAEAVEEVLPLQEFAKTKNLLKQDLQSIKAEFLTRMASI